MALFDLWLRLMKWGFVASSSPSFAASGSSSPFLLDRLSPWLEAESAIEERLGGGVCLCVGMGTSMTAQSSERQRRFLLLRRAKMITVIGQSKQEVAMESSRFAFLFVVLFEAGCTWLSIRFSYPQIRAKIRSSEVADKAWFDH